MGDYAKKDAPGQPATEDTQGTSRLGENPEKRLKDKPEPGKNQAISYGQAIDIIRAMSGQQNVITCQRVFLHLVGGDFPAAVLLSQLVFWTGRGADPDGFIWKTYQDLEDEIGLTKYQAMRARNVLERMQVLETKVKKALGSPTVHYKVLQDNLLKLMVSSVSSLSKVKKLNYRKSRNQTNESEETKQTITDITTDTTQTTTTDGTSSLFNCSGGKKFFTPLRGCEADKIIDDVISMEYAGKAKNVRALRQHLRKLVAIGKLEIPEGWNELLERKKATVERKDAYEASRMQEADAEEAAKKAVQEFDVLLADQQVGYIDRAQEMSQGMIESPMVLKITAAQLWASEQRKCTLPSDEYDNDNLNPMSAT
jgi:predicted DNA-binding ArsR family transcriptional regulator